MPNLLVLDIYFLLLLSGDGKGAGWIRLLHDGSVEDEGDTDVNNFINLTTWRFSFLGGDIKVEMMPPSWNNFLRFLLRFVVIRSDHNEGLGRICRSVFFFFGGRKKKTEDGRHKKEEVFPLRLQECWPPFVGFLFSSLLPGVCLCTLSVCLCSLLYEASYRSGVEFLDYTRLLDDQVVFQRACNLIMMYSAMI